MIILCRKLSLTFKNLHSRLPNSIIHARLVFCIIILFSCFRGMLIRIQAAILVAFVAIFRISLAEVSTRKMFEKRSNVTELENFSHCVNVLLFKSPLNFTSRCSGWLTDLSKSLAKLLKPPFDFELLLLNEDFKGTNRRNKKNVVEAVLSLNLLYWTMNIIIQ